MKEEHIFDKKVALKKNRKSKECKSRMSSCYTLIFKVNELQVGYDTINIVVGFISMN